MADPEVRARLAALMDQRRRDLRLTWDEVASRAGIHRETLRQIRAGGGSIRPLSATGIEDALDWDRGSVDAILHGGQASLNGGEPTPADLVRSLAETAANLDAYIERRAQEIAAPRIAAAEKQARELVAAVWHTAAFEKQRHDDLRTELGRQLDVAWKNYERLGAEFVPLPQRCECHDWYPIAEIGGWTQRDTLVREWATRPEIWDPGRRELSREDLRGRIAAVGGVQCEYALSATRNLDGSIELDKGVHRWTVAAELGIGMLPVCVNDATDSPMWAP